MEDAPDWVTLTGDEEVIWSGPPSPTAYAIGTTVPALLVFVGLVVLVVPAESLLPIDATVPGVVRLAAAGILVLFGLLGIASEFLGWYSHRFLVTTDELYHKQGLISRDVTNLRLDRVETTTFTQSALGRLLSYGDIHVATAGTDRSEVVFRKVGDPSGVVETITRQLDDT